MRLADLPHPVTAPRSIQGYLLLGDSAGCNGGDEGTATPVA